MTATTSKFTYTDGELELPVIPSADAADLTVAEQSAREVVYVAEASDLGIPAGAWPSHVRLTGVASRPILVALHTIGPESTLYLAPRLGLALELFND
jgi:hypothetical protein